MLKSLAAPLFVIMLTSAALSESVIMIDGELPIDLPDDGQRVVVLSSPGGSGAAAETVARHPVVVDGDCNSACAWSFVINEQSCFTPRAKFGFHVASDPGTGLPMPMATTFWLAQAKPQLADWLRKKFVSMPFVQVSLKRMALDYPERVCR